ncbi:winged helix-turn-helix domain-containing protein [Mangrovihabitans endophyticus]|uniref:winged helix-turn-helix domain-containing protein n=1 Tax=Mangrovihabitans endophyticus TaxID=1751298 RepID=UPI0027B989DC|nr:winged helix-turn-helix domain-containing protein [Mangrovihabitans endophyticus]
MTVAIPLTDDTLSPQAHRLIEAVRDLVEAGNGTVAYDEDGATPSVRDLAGVPTQPGAADGDTGAAPVGPALDQPAGTGPLVQVLAASRQVLLDGVALPLTRLEFDLLQFLAGHPRRVFTRGQLLAGVWGYDHTGERTVDVHVRRLRVKLGGQAPLITTVYGVGYRLADDARIVVQPQD